MKGDQFSLFPVSPEDIHNRVAKELGRVQGEDWEDFCEAVRIEVDARLSELNAKKPYPDYRNNRIIYPK